MTLDVSLALAAFALCLAAASPPVTGALARLPLLSRLRAACVRLLQRRFLVLCALAALPALALRALWLTRLPGGLSADEAFIAVNARFLICTGRDLSGSFLPPFLKGAGSLSSMGILTPLLTAPFVQALGMTVLAVRLPALLLSMGSLALMAGLMRRACGRSCALLVLLLGGLSPWAFMSARFATPAHALLFCLLLGAFLLGGVLPSRRPLARLYGGAAALAACMYTVDVAWLLAPLLLAGYAVSLARREFAKRHIAASAALFLLLSVPALCVAAVNLLGLEPFRLLGLEIERFDVPSFLTRFAFAGGWSAAWEAVRQGFVEFVGYLLLNIHTDEYTPSGVWTLWNQESAYAFLVPFLAVGACALAARLRPGRRGAGMPLALLGASLALFLLFTGFDSQEMYFVPAAVALVASAGMWAVARKLRLGLPAVAALVVAASLPMAIAYFDEEYMYSTEGQYREGLVEAIEYARALEPDTLYVTKELHPTVQPELTARAYACFALDVPAGQTDGFEVVYFPSLAPDPASNAVYVGGYGEIDAFDYDAYNCAEFGDYCVLSSVAVYGVLEQP